MTAGTSALLIALGGGVAGISALARGDGGAQAVTALGEEGAAAVPPGGSDASRPGTGADQSPGATGGLGRIAEPGSVGGPGPQGGSGSQGGLGAEGGHDVRRRRQEERPDVEGGRRPPPQADHAGRGDQRREEPGHARPAVE